MFYKGPFRKHYCGWRLFKFCLWNLSDTLQQLAESEWLQGLPESGYSIHIFLITPLYVFDDLIWDISFFFIISICQNLSVSIWRFATYGYPPNMNGKIWASTRKPPTPIMLSEWSLMLLMLMILLVYNTFEY